MPLPAGGKKMRDEKEKEEKRTGKHLYTFRTIFFAQTKF
jgi:hypothetical protein